MQGTAPVVVLSIHAAGRPRLNTQVSLCKLVGHVQLHAAALKGVASAEFRLALGGTLMEPEAPLIHYLNAGGALEAVAPGPAG